MGDVYSGSGMSSWNWKSQPRGYALDELNSIYTLLNGVQITVGSPDRWFWNYDSKVAFDRVPTFPNLSRRDIALASTLCPICKMEEEIVSHRYITYQFSNTMWKKLGSWWNISFPQVFDLNTIARNLVISGGGNGSIAKAFHGSCFILV
ncbi:RNA-directed DNA polymerase, eukaryota, Reverse transcriptase zinc-binding domain protein [Artemisia annua]|uniref:RNA-directed DNA polymerase, eukaryota, Reverse transcriptase zinc-binding domain protein n=1 Tax=Artemisia annua TaxID=35608 RepID=A0A2U1NNM6_ARTAN|nr:RNA-directed DNA polymerase, eukaryota, Reverse transcriptase zinc-binding domain protein [Artemisia annua]